MRILGSVSFNENGRIVNLTAPVGNTFPTETTEAELFVLKDHVSLEDGLYYYNGSTWIKQGSVQLDNTALLYGSGSSTTQDTTKLKFDGDKLYASAGFATHNSNFNVDEFGVISAQNINVANRVDSSVLVYSVDNNSIIPVTKEIVEVDVATAGNKTNVVLAAGTTGQRITLYATHATHSIQLVTGGTLELADRKGNVLLRDFPGYTRSISFINYGNKWRETYRNDDRMFNPVYTYTPVMEGSTTPGSHTYNTQLGEYQIQDGVCKGKLKVGVTTKDPAMAGNVRFTLPPGLTINTSAISTASINFIYKANSTQLNDAIMLISGGYLEIRDWTNNYWFNVDSSVIPDGFDITALFEFSVS